MPAKYVIYHRVGRVPTNRVPRGVLGGMVVTGNPNDLIKSKKGSREEEAGPAAPLTFIIGNFLKFFFPLIYSTKKQPPFLQAMNK